MKTSIPVSPKAASRRYQTQMAVSLVLYMVLLSACVEFLKGVESGPWRVVLALLPIVPLLWAFRAVIQYLARADELQRRVQLEALSIAAGATAFLCLTYGFLEDLAGFPHLSMWWAFVVVDLVWAAAAFILWRRYK
jgi:hypothetical protein